MRWKYWCTSMVLRNAIKSSYSWLRRRGAWGVEAVTGTAAGLTDATDGRFVAVDDVDSMADGKGLIPDAIGHLVTSSNDKCATILNNVYWSPENCTEPLKLLRRRWLNWTLLMRRRLARKWNNSWMWVVGMEVLFAWILLTTWTSSSISSSSSSDTSARERDLILLRENFEDEVFMCERSDTVGPEWTDDEDDEQWIESDGSEEQLELHVDNASQSGGDEHTDDASDGEPDEDEEDDVESNTMDGKNSSACIEHKWSCLELQTNEGRRGRSGQVECQSFGNFIRRYLNDGFLFELTGQFKIQHLLASGYDLTLTAVENKKIRLSQPSRPNEERRFKTDLQWLLLWHLNWNRGSGSDEKWLW